MAGDKRFRGLNKPCILLIGIYFNSIVTIICKLLLILNSDVGVLCVAIAGIERFVFKGVASNLVIYLTDVMEMSSSSAARTVNSWCGFTSMVPLLVAPLVDSYWNRYSTILASSFIYLVVWINFF